jgi:hypothetical protein
MVAKRLAELATLRRTAMVIGIVGQRDLATLWCSTISGRPIGVWFAWYW